MKHLPFVFLVLFSFLLTACQEAALKGTLKIKVKEEAPSITQVKVQNDQIIVTGNNLGKVTQAQIQGSANQQLSIEKQSAHSLVLNTKNILNLVVGQALNLVLSSAHASASFPFHFELQDGQVTAVKLHHMGASSGQVLRFNGSTWVPSSITSGQTYAGTYNAATDTPDIVAMGGVSGTFYIVTTPGTQDLGLGPINFNSGDWVMFNGSSWDKIPMNPNTVSSFNGRLGVVVPLNNDYSWSMLTKDSGKLIDSKLEEIEDVDITGIQHGDVLRWNDSSLKWEVDAYPSILINPGSVSSTELAAGSVDSSKISDGSIVNADISPTAAISQTKISNLVTDLAGKEPAITATSGFEYYRGDKTFAVLNTTAVPEGANLYFNNARVLGSVLTNYTIGANSSVTSDDTIFEAIRKLEAQNSAAATAQGNYVLRDGSAALLGNLQMGNNRITGLAAPSAGTDAATKSYVDTAVSNAGGSGSSQWTTDDTDIYYDDGNVGIGTNTPVGKLHIEADTAGSVAQRISANTANARLSTVVSSDASGFIFDVAQNDDGASNKNLMFATGSVERMRINYHGNVGIGVNDPDVKLVVGGQIRVTGGDPGVGKVLTSDATGLATWEAPASGGISGLTGDVTASGSGSVAATIANNAVTTGKILDGTILNADIADTTITYSKLNLVDNIIPIEKLIRLTCGVGEVLTSDLTFGYRCVADNATDSSKLPLAGGTMTGGLVLAGAPTVDLHAATKKYVDDGLAGASSKWTSVGSSIHYDDGNVGIGATSPESKLHLHAATGDYITFSTEVTDLDLNPADVKYVIRPMDAIVSDGNLLERGGLEFKSVGSNFNSVVLDGYFSFDGEVSVSKMLSVGGQIAIAGGNPGAGKVLTSNATGLATWEAPASGGISELTGDVTASGSGSVAATIANNAVTTGKILDGTILNADIADTTITYSKLNLVDNIIPIEKLIRLTCGIGEVVTSDVLSGYRCVADNATDSSKLPLAGGTMTGGLVLAGAPTVDLHAATKKYVDDGIAGASSKWTSAGSNIHYDDGNVGIGTTAPESKLHLHAATGDFITFSPEAYDGDGNFYDTKYVIRPTIGSDGAGGGYFRAGLEFKHEGSDSVGYFNFDGQVVVSRGLNVSEQILISGGNPGVGKVLTSNAFGLATWEAPASGGISGLTGDVTASGSGSVAATIANNAVTTGKILDGTITNADIANTTITYAKLNLADQSIPAAKLNIPNGAIGAEKLSIPDNSISISKLVRGDCLEGEFLTTNLTDGYKCAAASRWTTSGAGITYNGGNVGIGISIPEAKLHVVDISGNAIRIVDGNQGAGKVLTSDADGTASWQNAGLPNMDLLKIGEGAGSTTINRASTTLTTSPNLLLTTDGVVGAGVKTVLGFQNNSSDYASISYDSGGNFQMAAGHPSMNNNSDAYSFLSFKGSSQILTFPMSTNFSSSISQAFTGTTTPAITSTANSLTTGSIVSLTTSSNSLNSLNGLIFVNNTGTSTSGMIARIKTNSNVESGLSLLANGNVGIGVSAPSETLEVDGNVKAASFISTSDQRLKRDFASVNGLEIINQLNGYHYKWKNNGEGDYGVVAQEVEAVMPEAVATDSKSGFKAVKYNGLLAPIIEAIKELYKMITGVDEELQELKMKNTELELRLQKLEAKYNKCD